MDQHDRTRMLLGDEALTRLRRARVIVFGVGGVGGYAAETLARAGVGEITLVDDDTVSLTNLNRQIIALHSTLGRPKTEVMAERIRDIDPEIRAVPLRMFYTPETADAVDLRNYDCVIDCVDTVTAKLEIVTRCRAAGVPVISAMGAGNKLDPSCLRAMDISQTSVDPLARVMRRELRARGISRLRVVCSTEPPLKPAPAPGEEGGAHPKRATPGSVSFVPAAMGLIIGGEAVKAIAGGRLEALRQGVKEREDHP